MLSDDDLESYRLSPEQVKELVGRKRTKRKPQRKRARRFVKGPIPEATIARANRAHRNGLAVLLVVKIISDMESSRTNNPQPVIALTEAACAGIQIGRHARLAAAKALAVAGLLHVEWSGKRAPQVSIPAGVFK